MARKLKSANPVGSNASISRFYNRYKIMIWIAIIVILYIIFKPKLDSWLARRKLDVTRPSSIDTSDLTQIQKEKILRISNTLAGDIEGFDWSAGFNKSNVIPSKVYLLTSDELYRLGELYLSTYGYKLSDGIENDLWIYFYPSDQDKHTIVVNKLHQLGL